MSLQNSLISVDDILVSEHQLLQELSVAERLTQIVSTGRGLRFFAERFYFVRYDFYRMNFVVGARCSPDERAWSGLAMNLFEEIGGSKGGTHNQLYRDFMSSVGTVEPPLDEEPPFARTFNRDWEAYCTTVPVPEAVAAIAVYEILDAPDYSLLLSLMTHAGVDPAALRFFEVHAKASHFNLFTPTLSWLQEQDAASDLTKRAASFVLANQRKMWAGLLQDLEHQFGGPVSDVPIDGYRSNVA